VAGKVVGNAGEPLVFDSSDATLSVVVGGVLIVEGLLVGGTSEVERDIVLKN
jgi:hypothetical protein